MLTELVQIRSLSERAEGENLRFRRFVKAHHLPERLFHRIARKVEQQIDCRTCANCCRETRVAVSRADIDRVARFLGMSPGEIAKHYTVRDPSEGTVLLQIRDECVFLDGNLCTVYEARPRACREFPYVASDHRSLGGRMASVCKHATICPIIYNSLEEYKHVVGYARAHPSHPD